MFLASLWYVLFLLIIAGYVVLDGFDLGVGILHPLVARTDEERRISLNSIGPVWDGNEVWLVVGGGVLFAAFPEVYATLFSGFYVAFMLVLALLILRVVSIEFRSKRTSEHWKQGWDWVFGLASLLLSLLLGVAFGNIAQGVPIDSSRNMNISFFGMLTPYPLLVGLTAVVLLAQHGALYLDLKAEGDLQRRLRRVVPYLTAAFIVLIVATGLATALGQSHLTNWYRQGWPLVVPLMAVVSIAVMLYSSRRRNEFRAFAASSFTILFLLASVGLAQYPALLTSTINRAYSLTIFNSSSSQKTLTVMLIIACIGLPLVIAYTVTVYWLFRGKVRLGERSY